jgi:ferredoxin-type protein NapG
MTISFATVAGLFSYSDFFVPNRKLLRPPGVIQEEQFLRDCIKCNACADVCPTRGISIAHLDDGLLNVGTPELAGYCMVYRGLEEPSPAFAQALNESAQAWSASVQAWTASVQAWKERTLKGEVKEACLECIKVCPSGALKPISIDQLHLGTAVIDKNLCLVWRYLNCTFPCIYACPFDAIHITAGPVVDPNKCTGCNICSFVCLTRETGPTSIVVQPTGT